MRGSLKNNITVKRSTENQTQRGKKQKNGDQKPVKKRGESEKPKE